jgi:fructokinase
MVDATAAGDAFVGGLLYQLAALDGKGKERLQPLLDSLPRLHAVLRYAAACGAIAVTRQGSFTAMPTDAETRHFMETQT